MLNYSAFVWFFSAISLFVYGFLGLINQKVPGIEQLVGFIASLEGSYILLAAFLSILFEGIYVIGSFFPGASFVTFLTLFSLVMGPLFFVATIAVIFIGWVLSGVINILIAKFFQKEKNAEYLVSDKTLLTWFPSFRANYEVMQITEGGSLLEVFISSVRVKFFVSIATALFLLSISFFVDVNQVSNEEGFIGVFIIASISLFVGFLKLNKKEEVVD